MINWIERSLTFFTRGLASDSWSTFSKACFKLCLKARKFLAITGDAPSSLQRSILEVSPSWKLPYRIVLFWSPNLIDIAGFSPRKTVTQVLVSATKARFPKRNLWCLSTKAILGSRSWEMCCTSTHDRPKKGSFNSLIFATCLSGSSTILSHSNSWLLN